MMTRIEPPESSAPMDRPPALRFANLLALLLIFGLAFAPAVPIAVTGDGAPGGEMQGDSAGRVTGLFVEGVFAVSVVDQPDGQPGYVSTVSEAATYFSAAADFGSLGFLAHNYLAGAHFFDIQVGQVVTLIYGENRLVTYRVNQIRRFQATSPTSPYSSFVDLDRGGVLTYSELFYQTYGVSGQLVLQTCIAAEGDPSWGRLFILATPVPPGY
jgi:hypothetical protein